MDIFLYAMIFIAGTVFGSFCTLAVYRIPRKENITYVRSHCVSCNHKLSPLDLIPILSYLFLGGKCRYCKEKIRSRYILLEITSGLVFLLIALSFKISIYSSLYEFIKLFITYLFVTGLFLVGGIDKENYIIPDSVLLYLIIVSSLNIIVNSFNSIGVINNLAGFFIIPILLLIIDFVFKLDKTKEFPIGFGDIKYLAVIGLFVGHGTLLLILPLALVIALIGYLIHKYKEIPLGYYLSISTIIVFLFNNQLSEFISLISIN